MSARADALRAANEQRRATRLARAEAMQVRINAGLSASEIAKEFGVSEETVFALRRDKLLSFPPRQRGPAARPPKPPAQTVEEWLAAGGQIKRCPAVALIPTQAEISAEDRAAMQAHYVAHPEPASWKQQRLASYRSAKGKGLVT